MESHKLMRLLIPANEVKSVQEFTGLNKSILYQERREAGKEAGKTGTRNTIDRLDLFCEYILDDKPEVVLMVGERYTRMYANHVEPLPENLTMADVYEVLGEVSEEVGDVLKVMAKSKSLSDCTREVVEAKEKLERALRIFAAVVDQEGGK